MKKAILISTFVCLAMIGCTKKNPPIKGKREPVLILEEDLTLSPDLASVKVTVPEAWHNLDWPQSGGGFDHSVSSYALGASLKKVWSHSIGSGSTRNRQLLSTPVVANGVVYTLDASSTVCAFLAKDGKKLWHMPVSPLGRGQDSVGGGLAYAEGKLYITTAFAELLCLSAENGQIVWRYQLDSPVRSAPIVKEGRVYFVTINNCLEVVNARNGKPLWTHSGISETAGILGGASPAIGSGVAVAPYSSGEVYGLRLENGFPLWSEALTSFKHVDSITSINHIRAQPIIDGNTVFVISHSGKMMALDVRTGAKIWTHEMGGVSSPVVAGQFLFLISNGNKLVCLTKDKGAVKWVTFLPLFKDEAKLKDRIVWAGPLLAGDRLIVTGSTGNLEMYATSTGKKMGHLVLPHPTLLPPIVADKTLFVVTDDGTLVAYR